MKKILLFITLGFATLFMASCNSSKPLSEAQQARVAEVAFRVTNFDFDFIATSIRPIHGRTLQLTGGYLLELNQNQVRSYLPYIGRSYVVPSNPMSIGMDFKTKNFVFSSEENANGSFTVRIKPTDLTNIEDKGMEMILQISRTGSATLNVNFLNRQSVSYSGYIE